MSTTSPSSNGHHLGGVNLTEYLERDVLPRLTAEQIYTHPAHNWHKDSDKWRGGCPWHHSKSGTSFNVSVTSLLWYCPGCGVGGTPVQYMHRMRGGQGSPHGAEFLDIVRELAQKAGTPFPEIALDPKQQERARKIEVRRAMLLTVFDQCSDNLWQETEQAKRARAYLYERGYTDEHIKYFHLGLYVSNKALGRLLFKKGFTAEDIKEAAVCFWKMNGYITFPWYDGNGWPLTLYGSWPSRTPPENTPKKMALPNPKDKDNQAWEATKRSPYMFDRALKAGCKEIVVVEGVTDVTICHAYGDPRVVACVGAELSKGQVATLKKYGIEKVYIALDPDQAGDAGIASCKKSLLNAGITPYICPKLPDELDPDDFVVQRSISAWMDHVSRGIHAYRHEAQVILARNKPETGWTDASRDKAIDQAVVFARQQPKDRQVDLGQYLVPELSEGVGIDRNILMQKIHTRGGSTNRSKATARLLADNSGEQHLTDSGNAKRMATRHGHDLRYCDPWSKWLIWDGSRWRIDDTQRIKALSKETVISLGEWALQALSQLRSAESDSIVKLVEAP